MAPQVSESTSGEDRFAVYPSDVGQSVLRIILVTGICLWSYLRTPGDVVEAVSREGHLQFALVYLALSVALYFWTKFIVRRNRLLGNVLIITRVFGIFTDIGAVSIYTALSGPEGIILYPIYLTSSIGYGYRFGVRYLYLALALSASSFTLVLQMNPFIAGNQSLIVAFYLGIIIVPFYAAVLLRQHQDVLERLKSVNAARSRFIANMSHELRTPLHAIISIADLLRESHTRSHRSSRSERDKLQMISESGEHLLTLVNRVLDVASAESGLPSSIETETVDLHSVIFSALRICQATAQKKGLAFAWQFDAGVPSTAETSAQMLKEILINTVGNAVKYTQEGSVVVRVLLHEQASTAGLRIEIDDTGIGISPKLLPTIFEPFTLGDDSTSRRFAGTGLGLTLTKRYVDQLRGTIHFESRDSGGTRCQIFLPITPATRKYQIHSRSEEERVKTMIYSSDAEFVRQFSLQAADYLDCSPPVLLNNRTRNDWLPDLVVIEGISKEVDEKSVADARVRVPGAVIAICAKGPSHLIHETQVNTVISHGSRSDIASLARIARAANQWAERSEPAATEIPDRRAYKILVADDNPTNLKTAELSLAAYGHQVHLASSGESALSLLESEPFDLALVDLHMPNMSGLDVLQLYQYLFIEPRTPIVILTADVTAHAREEALAAGAVAVLSKPLRLRELRDAIDNHACRTTPTSPQLGHALPPISVCKGPSRSVDPSVLAEFLELGVAANELREMVAQFATDTDDLIQRLQDSLVARDFEMSRANLHSLKGSCGTVGATALLERVQITTSDLARGHVVDGHKVGQELRTLLSFSLAEIDDLLRETA